MASIEVVWQRIRRHAGEPFETIKGLPFTYSVPGNYLLADRTVRNLSRSNFEKALEQVPCYGPGIARRAAGSQLHVGHPHGRPHPRRGLVDRRSLST